MKCTWKEWKGGELTSWHGISHCDGTGWGISSMTDLGHETVEGSPLCCCECSPDLGTSCGCGLWSPGQSLVLISMAVARLRWLCPSKPRSSFSHFHHGNNFGWAKPTQSQCLPLWGKVSCWSLKSGDLGKEDDRATALGSQWGKYLLQAWLRARNSRDSIFSRPSSVSWLHFHPMTQQSSATVFCCPAQFAKSKYMGVDLVLWAWHQRTHRKSWSL